MRSDFSLKQIRDRGGGKRGRSAFQLVAPGRVLYVGFSFVLGKDHLVLTIAQVTDNSDIKIVYI